MESRESRNRKVIAITQRLLEEKWLRTLVSHYTRQVVYICVRDTGGDGGGGGREETVGSWQLTDQDEGGQGGCEVKTLVSMCMTNRI